jgi:hypothetical protein
MSAFDRANFSQRQTVYRYWYRYKSQSYILRTQLGFERLTTSRPQACLNCFHYHGKAYGQTNATRTPLICAFHPYGWM